MKKLAPLLGIDLSSDVEKRLRELEARQQQAPWTGDRMSPSELEEMKRLRIQVEKEAAEKAAQMSFETIVRTIKEATAEARRRLNAPSGLPASSASEIIITDGNAFDDGNIVRELRELNRNSQTRTVDIVGGG